MEQKVRSGRRGSEVVTPPDGGWGWMIIASCFLVTICTRAVTRCVSIFFVEFQLHFDRDYSTTAWIHSLVDCTTMLCAPLGSLMERHLSCRATVLMGGLLACTGLVLSSFASSVEFLYVSLGILTGVGFALCYTPAIGMVGRYFSNRKALAYGIAMSGSGIGTFILAPVVQLLIELYSWRGALLILGAFVSNLCVCGALMRPVEATQHLRGKEQDYLAAPQDGEKVKQQDVKTSENQPANRRITNYELDSGKLLPEKLAKVLLSKDPSDSSLRKAKTAECVIFSNNKLTDKILAEIKLTDPRLADGSTLEDLKLVENLNFSNKLAKIDDNVDPKLPLAIDTELEDPSVDQVRLSEIKQLAPDAHGMSAISQPSSAPRSRCWGRGRSLLAVDLSFLLMPDFLLLSVSFLFLAYGCSVPIVYLVPYAVSVGAEHQHAAYLMSIFGVSGIVGNITFGWITDRRCLRRYRMLSYMLAIAMEGLCCLFLPSLRSITLLFLFSVVYGYFDGAYVALIPVVTSDVVGPAHLTSALGVVYFLHAVPYLVSPPIGGLLVDRTGDYTAAFYLSAASLLFSPVFISIFMAIRRCWSSRTHSEPLKV